MSGRGRQRALALAVAALGLTACAQQVPVPATAPRAPPPDVRLSMPALEMRIYALVERERERLDPKAVHLTLDHELAGVAQAHSDEMAREHALDHRTADGQTVATLMMGRDKNFYGVLGENLAGDYYDASSGIDPNATARRVVDSWLSSPSHRDNLVSAEYARAGIGAAADSRMIYVTLLFSGAATPPPVPPPAFRGSEGGTPASRP